LTLQIPGRTYPQFSTVLGFPGTDGLRGIQQEVVPVQELSRFLLDSKIKRMLYMLNVQSISGTASGLADWGDASDWDDVLLNGVLTIADADLPQPDDDRIITNVSLQVSGTPTDYSTGILNRVLPNPGAGFSDIATWGAMIASHLTAPQTGIKRTPLALGLNELGINFRIVGTDVNASCDVHVEMIAAERGVMNVFPGV